VIEVFDRKTTKLRTNKKLKQQLNRSKPKVIRNEIKELRNQNKESLEQKVLENESILGIISGEKSFNLFNFVSNQIIIRH
jgi:hypothetical protein